MLKKLQIQNFQSHSNSEIEFSDGFNLIVGPSNNGKSSILRAFEWLVTNRPLGHEFIRHHTKETTITASINNANIIRKRNKDSSGSYAINNNDPYSMISGNIPESVIDILNLDSINIQPQIDQHFLIVDTPGQIAKKINTITGIERAMDGIKRLKDSHTHCIRRLSDIKFETERIEEYLASGVLEKQQELKNIHKVQVKLTSSQTATFQKINSIIDILNQIKWNKQHKELYAGLDPVVDLSNEIGTLLKDKRNIEREIKKLDNLLNDILFVSNGIQVEDENIQNLNDQLSEFKGKLTQCPYCLTELTEESKNNLLMEK
jgi:exonuclease SbcC